MHRPPDWWSAVGLCIAWLLTLVVFGSVLGVVVLSTTALFELLP